MLRQLLVSLILIPVLRPDAVAQPQTITVGSTVLEVREVATGLDIPWEIAYGPDGLIYFTERRGRIRRLDPESGALTTLLNIQSSVHQQSESGMLGLALHPGFPATPHIFVAYTYSIGPNAVRERIVRYTLSGDALADPLTLLENIPGASTHNGCRLMFLPDGTLLATTGDAQQTSLAQDTFSLAGKILRLNTDGSIPSDNPFGPDCYAFSMGHRNAQGIVLGPNGKIYSAEHGPDTNDELNIIEAGGNFGWPTVNGFCLTPAEQQFCTAMPNYRDPIKVWFANSTIAPSDLIYFDHPSIPEWEGRYLVSVLKDKHLRAVRVDDTDGTEVLEDIEYLTNQFGRLRDICASPDGRVYLATNGPLWANTQPNTHKIIELRNPAWDPTGLAAHGTLAFSAMPNPASDVLRVSMAKDVESGTAELMDISGRVVMAERFSGRHVSLGTGTLPAGIYVLRLSAASGSSSKRIALTQ